MLFRSLGTAAHGYAVFYKQHFEDAEFKAAKGGLLHTRVLELEKAVEANYGPMRVALEKELFPAEKALVEGRPKFEAEFKALYAKNKKKAMKKLDAYVAVAFENIAGLTAKLLANAPGD